MDLTKGTKQQKYELLQMLERKKELCDYQFFSMRNIKIINKKKKQVALVQNAAQMKLDDKIKELREAGQPPRIIVLKSRQMGISTDMQGRIVWTTTTKHNSNALIVAHTAKATSSIFSKSKYMVDNLPEDKQPLQKASNATEIVFDKPSGYKGVDRGINSKISLQTAGSTSLARGDTYNIVHLSEFAFWEGTNDKDPATQLTGINQAVPDETDTCVVIESTANGYNAFKDLWDDAVDGKNGWTPMFFPWYTHEEYVRPLDIDVQDFLDTMEDYEVYLREIMKLPLERINWWRHTKLINCNGKLNMMKQENPTTPEEAFLMSGSPVFDTEKVAQRIEVLRKEYEVNPYKEGYFKYEWNNAEHRDFIKRGSIEFVENKDKPYVRIYEDNKKGYPYVIGGDTKGEASGKTRDFYTGTLINNATGNRAATVYMDLTKSPKYTYQMYCLYLHYNKAMIGIEINFNLSPIEELERLKCDNQYMRRRYDSMTNSYEKKEGWKTDGNTRPMMIDAEVGIVDDNIDLINDIPTLKEMLTFVYDKNGRPDAMSGKHDDLLFSEMIANAIRPEYTMKAEGQANVFDIERLPKDMQQDYFNAPPELRSYLETKWKNYK